MNILTFDIEDWYNSDFITRDFAWDKFEVRIYKNTERILEELERRGQRATFFCLGWLAEKHPKVIRQIQAQGHSIGCHSYQHELAFRFTREEFKNDTEMAKKRIEDVLGVEVDAYRAPGFSITAVNLWALDVLAELGFRYDCSIFPDVHDCGGYPDYGSAEPALLQLPSGAQIKEFPTNIHHIFGKKVVFSGGGYFRLFPYTLIKRWAKQSPYMMTYFHPRDFDPEQPMIRSLPLVRKFKSYVGLSRSFHKLQKLLDDFDFIDIVEADKQVDWGNVRIVTI
jgi:polysaccharide deacetylase family protein (PEP-CTERM system associated)